jgi:predicted RNase H-like HicB family nuclease
VKFCDIIKIVRKKKTKKLVSKFKGLRCPFLLKNGDGFYIVECPVLEGCYTQGKTIDEALKNIREVIEMILEEKEAQEILKSYRPSEISLHTITI